MQAAIIFRGKTVASNVVEEFLSNFFLFDQHHIIIAKKNNL